MTPVSAQAVESHAVLIGSGDAARRFAENLAETLPALSPSQAEEIIGICEHAGLRCPLFPDTSRAPLRAPHCTAHPIGIFGGGMNSFPGEFKLAIYGVLLFRDIECFSDEIVARIAACLAQSQPVSFPRVLIHADGHDRIPAQISNLGLQTISLEKAPPPV